MFGINRGCDADGVGSSSVGLPAVNHVCVKPNQRVDTCRQNLDQSYSLCLKPKFETVWNLFSYWLATHPGVGVFLFWTRKRWLAQLATEKEKRLVCCVAGPSKCLRLLGNKGTCIHVSCVFFLCFFRFVLKVWANLLNNFSPLLFFPVFSRCCLYQFYALLSIWVDLSVVSVWGNNKYACCVFSVVFLDFKLLFIAGFGCSWFCFCVDRISALSFGMLLCCFVCVFPIFFLCPRLHYILAWYCAFRLHFNPFICSFFCWFGAVLFILVCARVCHTSKQSRYLRIGASGQKEAVWKEEKGPAETELLQSSVQTSHPANQKQKEKAWTGHETGGRKAVHHPLLAPKSSVEFPSINFIKINLRTYILRKISIWLSHKCFSNT